MSPSSDESLAHSFRKVGLTCPRRVAEQKFPDLIVRPVAAQFMEHSVIALFEFQESNNQITIAREHHYSLVAPEELAPGELASYREATRI